MLRSPVTAAVLVALVVSTPAAAATIDVSTSFYSEEPALDFYTLDKTFTLPVGYSNASLNISEIGIDDRGVLKLNGAIIASTGITGFGSGPSSMVLTSGGANDPFAFQYGHTPFGVSGPLSPILGPFVEGVNLLHFIVNDTGLGVNGNLNPDSYPTRVTFVATVTYDIAPVPLQPSTAAQLAGVALLGLLFWRRKRKFSAVHGPKAN